MDQKLDENLQESLMRLCRKLQSSLYITEKSLEIAKQRFEQIQAVRKPWASARTEPNEIDCICKSETIKTSNNDEQNLLENITQTLNTAQILRTAIPSKSSTKLIKKDVKCSKSSTSSKSVPVSKKSSKKSITDLHKPSCSLYKLLPEKSSLNLNEAITIYKIPTVLTNTLKLTGDFLLNKNSKNSKNKLKENFLQLLEKQNQTLWSLQDVQNFTIYSFPKYISTLQSLQKNKPMKLVNPWLLYKKVQDLQDFIKQRNAVITTQLWDDILQCIRNDVMPVLEDADLDVKQKIYIYKIIKTITNFTVCTIPNVPIFRINDKVK